MVMCKLRRLALLQISFGEVLVNARGVNKIQSDYGWGYGYLQKRLIPQTRNVQQ